MINNSLNSQRQPRFARDDNLKTSYTSNGGKDWYQLDFVDGAYYVRGVVVTIREDKHEHFTNMEVIFDNFFINNGLIT